jgi:hypothetical chaperone protein
MAACGLDFGTSNTTLGVAATDGVPRLVALEAGATTLPSAVFFDFESATMAVGQTAIDAYVGHAEGRFMRALKSVLGTALIDEETTLRGSRIGFRAVIGRFLGEVKRRGEAACGAALDTVVHGRPVRFVDGDDAADARAERALAEIASGIGFRHVAFQFEPIAAAFEYERQIAGEEIALVADIGGGTSDFSVVRLGPDRRRRVERAADILGNEGVRVGGTDFDRELSLATVMPLLGYRSAMRRRGLAAPNLYFTDLATWSKINFLYTPKVMSEMRDVRRESAHPELIDRLIRVVALRRGHTLAMEVEGAKVALSETPRVTVPLDWIEQGLAAAIERKTLETATAALARRIGERARRCLAQAGLAAERIDAVFLTGGSTLLPHVRSSILRVVPSARIVEGDKFGAVGLGLTVDALRRYGG